jgi:ATP-dependent Lon protease
MEDIMPVFDFNRMPEAGTDPVCTYVTFRSNEPEASPEKPILVLDNSLREWAHHSTGKFTNPVKRTSFEFDTPDGVQSADILRIDARFTSLLGWLGENHINVRLSGRNVPEGYAVYKIREIAFGGGTKLSSEDGFLQFMIERLFASPAPSEEMPDDEADETGDDMRLTSLQSITDFMTCAGRTLPDNIRLWARRNLAVARSSEVSPEERRHAQRALSIMMNIQWKSNYFESIDPVEARRILDEELYGLESVKQRIIETIIQINRSHTLPSYGLLLIGPAGTGKSQMHNSHLDIAASYGIPVLILVCVLLTCYMHHRGRSYTQKSSYIYMLAFCCAILLGIGEAAVFAGGMGIYIFVGTFLLLANMEDEEQ